MTTQEKIRYLRRYREGEQEIRQLERELEVWRSRAEKITPGGGEGGGGRSDRIQNAVGMLVELQEKLADQLAALARMREEIVREIDRVEELRLRQILRMRYIDGMKWEEIAVAQRIDYRWLLRLHGRALDRLTIERHP